MARRWNLVARFAALGIALVMLLAGCATAPAPAAPAAPAPGAPAAPAAPAAPKGAPIKIAALTSLSGPFVTWGAPVPKGMKLAADEINKAGGVLGRPIEILERDTRGNPDEGVTLLRGLVERDGVVAAGGIISSGVGLATSREAEVLQVPLFLTKSGSHTILTKSSRYTFRMDLVAAPMAADPIVAFIKERGIKRVGVIIADYEWGHAFKEGMERKLKPLTDVKMQVEVAPVPEADFTTYLRRLQPLNPELLILTGHPPGQFAAVKQATELKIGQFITGAWNPPQAWVERVGEPGYGRIIDFSSADYEDPGYKALAVKFHQQFKELFEANALTGYAWVKMVADAIQKTNSTDPKKIAEAIRTGTFKQPGYSFPITFTEWGELKQSAPVIFTVEKGDPGEINPGAGWRAKVLFRSPAIEPYVPAK